MWKAKTFDNYQLLIAWMNKEEISEEDSSVHIVHEPCGYLIIWYEVKD
jgi:hypothetical protein